MPSTILDKKIRQAVSVTEPATLAEAKTQCIVDHTDDDALITSLITRARVQVENKTRLSLVEKTVVLTVELKGCFKLPFGPIRSITTIERRQGFTDDDPDWVPLTSDEYRTEGADFITIISPVCGTYRVSYTVGYTDSAGLFPIEEGLKDAVLAQVAFLYENRGDNNQVGKFSELAKEFLKGYIDYSHV